MTSLKFDVASFKPPTPGVPATITVPATPELVVPTLNTAPAVANTSLIAPVSAALIGKTRLAIIDGDVLAYNAFRPRWHTKRKRGHDGKAIQIYDENGVRIPIEYSAKENAMYFLESWENFKADVKALLDTVYCTDYVLAVANAQAPTTRYSLFPEYKANRSSSQPELKPLVADMRRMIVTDGYGIYADNCETDDFISIWAHECMSVNRDYVICSIDKDLLCLPGKHYRIHKKEYTNVDPETGMRFYYQQIISGDPTDNIAGVPGLGPIKSERIIAGCADEAAMQEAVVDAYLSAFGDDWEKQLHLNGTMIYLKKTHDDNFTFDHWPVVQELRNG